MSYYTKGDWQWTQVYDYTGNNKYYWTNLNCLSQNENSGLFALKLTTGYKSGNYGLFIGSGDGTTLFSGNHDVNNIIAQLIQEDSQSNKIFRYYENQKNDYYPRYNGSSPTDADAPERTSQYLKYATSLEISTDDTTPPGQILDKITFPIFDVSDSWDAVNAYLKTGDDSGADNYEDLHPMQYTTTVWMDGKYPNLYWKTEVGEEDTPDTIDLICDIYARPLIEYDKTFTNQYSLNNVQYVQYSDYANPTKVPSIGGGTIPTRYMLHVYPKDNLDKDYAARIVFDIHDDGTISDVTLQSGKHHTIIISDSPIPSDSDYPDEQTNFNHDMTTSFQDGTSINTLTTTYRISPSQLRVLGNFLWSNTFKDGILGLVNYPLENIVSLKCMPVNLGGTETNIKIGNVDTGIHGDKCDYRVSGYSAYVGSCTIKRPFNNFMDYTEVELSIYLPFIGYKPLDAVMVMGRKIELTYIYDCVLGNCMAVLYVYDDNGNKIMFDCHQGTCGIDIAITSTNRADIENGMINSVLSGVGHLASAYAGNIGGLLGVAGDVFNGTTQGFHTQSTGVGNPSLMTKMDTTAFVILKRPQIMDVDKQHYGHHYGYPCNLYKKLKNLSGFTQTKNFVCSLINNATDEEKAEIESLLNSGIYIM